MNVSRKLEMILIMAYKIMGGDLTRNYRMYEVYFIPVQFGKLNLDSLYCNFSRVNRFRRDRNFILSFTM